MPHLLMPLGAAVVLIGLFCGYITSGLALQEWRRGDKRETLLYVCLASFFLYLAFLGGYATYWLWVRP